MKKNMTFHKKKVWVVLLGCMLLMVGLMGRLVYLMCFRSDYYYEKAKELHERERDIKAARGEILDAKGRVLASNRTVCTISVIHSQIKEPEKVIALLSEKLEMDEAEVRKRVEKISSIERVKTNVEKSTGDEIRESNLAGVKVDEDYRRYYPLGSLASKVIGFTGGDNQGIIGLEVKYEDILKGKPGKILTTTDARGVEIDKLGEAREDPTDGKTLMISLDANIQKFAQQAALKVMEEKQAERVSILLMNPQNGEIYACVNVPEFDLNDPFALTDDLKIQSRIRTAGKTDTERKQELLNQMWRNPCLNDTYEPGSTFKIVSTYAAALNEKGMTLATTYEDQPITYDNGAPVNNASGSFNGTTTIRTAIRNSVNTVAVQCFEDVTPELGLKYLDNFGFTTLAHGTEADTDANGNVYTDANLPTALGGLTYGVKNVELCAAYAAIANGGNYIKPVYYTKILDHNGNVLIENNSVGRSVIKETTAYLLTSALEDVVQNGTGTACQLDNMAVAGKTGTTDAYNDLWFVGYTPYYTCAVWSGYDGNQKIPEGDARNFHKTLWRKVMNRIHQGMEYKDFEVPDGIEQISICADTGLLPRVGCPVTEEYFDVGTMPTEYCDQHFYEYDESQDEDMEIYDANATPTPDPENPDGTDNADGSGGDGTGGDGTGGDGTGGDGTGGGDIQYPDESGGDSGNDDIYYY